MQEPGILYVVATPIGNLEDVTLRALRVLQEVDGILCEDTRVTKRLLERYKIVKPLKSYHAHSKLSQTQRVLSLLEQGKNLALVSDAGTPCISDPGVALVAQVREYFGVRAQVVPLPGPSAVLSALSASGLPSSDFLFLGFLPHKKGRETLFQEIAASQRTVVFYESPHRILKTLTSLAEHLDSPRIVVVARELTKVHEEVVCGTAANVLLSYTDHADKVKGEFVVMVSGK
ncbi:MAG: 16S rRNA (cytidine(1402)-2'-O)-methyltransferase [Parcubacteria group bacterium CG08_land_8_20_14_0_20_48_21]|nr:MAG: 16S rRNA (cytidine(1402)-2'-O)-methyltransferase [Parcubacteria group bacterium CG2_30_48_51]PIS32484.1 MAG: 16S rRNA (cytidine(1402)-2'-O)-methyltransferase [Parcubacteria group bacterium CG08_land_8_20_14_0_20_48_21]PIW78832.1 MAG: 16S rRNA (cytidine(1402)-2'-O)-methyltransferase [Parcubacteria group bacterium CG_4_8_14_3_um_filter_48_16]PIY78005.1 MAG: 16S rRNA (cytidine(1402)-2'-O)-methyltransferase [Parcubacteria group bacterium CG_4_10_14_0_8_um_filter_48_154]PIZ77122.1 MAG: 16S r